jgi:uncharacterized protein with von Willebrand factor type A (vWA) domain
MSIVQNNNNILSGRYWEFFTSQEFKFGDDFQIHLQKTIMNSLYREPTTPPMKLNVEDFEVFKTEELTRSATVLMLDLSLSMPMRGNFEAAKRVAVALDGQKKRTLRRRNCGIFTRFTCRK